MFCKHVCGVPQSLHRDGEYLMVQLPGEQIEHEISCIWATHDFTEAMGVSSTRPSHAQAARPLALHL